jgi:endoglucanase
VAELGAGINMGNTLEAVSEGEGTGGRFHQSYFDAYRKAGFKTVRVPVRWDTHMDHSEPFKVNATWLQRIEQVVNYGLGLGLHIIINSHNDKWIDLGALPEFMGALPRFLSLWEQISNHFSSFDSKLLFEIYNEPHNMSLQSLNILNQKVLPIIRKQNPTRTVLLGGDGWMGIWWLRSHQKDFQIDFNRTVSTSHSESLATVKDTNLMLEVHNYGPMAVTTPKSNGWPQTEWGNSNDIGKIQDDFGFLSNFSQQHNLSIVLGEYACAAIQPNKSLRALWYDTMSAAAFKVILHLQLEDNY